VILPGAAIGRACNICAHTYIENLVTIGEPVTIHSGVYLWDHMDMDMDMDMDRDMEDDVFIGPNVTFTHDKYPRSKHYQNTRSAIRSKRGGSIGAIATIAPGITIGEFAMVGAGTVVTKDVADNTQVMGNLASRVCDIE
jgi:acetyltransferase-like isoleucine patch superfamily enzyme